MSKNLTASDRKSLIRLASTLPKGSKERRAILAGLNKVASEFVEFENAGDMSLKEFEDFFKGLAKNFAGGEKVSKQQRKTMIEMETYNGTLSGNFDREFANGELSYEGEDRSFLNSVKSFLKKKGKNVSIR